MKTAVKLQLNSSTKKKILAASLAVIICVILAISSTMAWYVDSDVAINTFTFGELDVDIQNKDGDSIDKAQARAIKFADSDGNIYSDEKQKALLFEPGATFFLEDIYVVNKGSIPLNYKVKVDDTGATKKGSELDPNADLMDALDITVTLVKADPANNEELDPDDSHRILPGEKDKIQVKIHMQEEAGNKFQDTSVSGLNVQVIAYQDGITPDSDIPDFGN